MVVFTLFRSRNLSSWINTILVLFFQETFRTILLKRIFGRCFFHGLNQVLIVHAYYLIVLLQISERISKRHLMNRGQTRFIFFLFNIALSSHSCYIHGWAIFCHIKVRLWLCRYFLTRLKRINYFRLLLRFMGAEI